MKYSLLDNYVARVHAKDDINNIGITIGFLIPKDKYDRLNHKIKEEKIKQDRNFLFMSDDTYYELVELLSKI